MKLKKLNHKHEKEILKLKIEFVKNLQKISQEEFIFETKYRKNKINDEKESENNIDKSPK